NFPAEVGGGEQAPIGTKIGALRRILVVQGRPDLLAAGNFPDFDLMVITRGHHGLVVRAEGGISDPSLVFEWSTQKPTVCRSPEIGLSICTGSDDQTSIMAEVSELHGAGMLPEDELRLRLVHPCIPYPCKTILAGGEQPGAIGAESSSIDTMGMWETAQLLKV